jgi:hypothetical protein
MEPFRQWSFRASWSGLAAKGENQDVAGEHSGPV